LAVKAIRSIGVKLQLNRKFNSPPSLVTRPSIMGGELADVEVDVGIGDAVMDDDDDNAIG
jgi:hypothetical protein